LAVFGLAWSFWKDARRITRANRRLAPDQAKAFERAVYQAGGERFRREAFRLGGLIIKVGQFLSARTDVLPLEFTRELRALQDQVPAAPYARIREILQEAYEGDLDQVFSHFDERPIAAASLGQVHRAQLTRSQQWVAVKVQRPGILDLAAIDLAALGYVMRALTRWTKAGRRVNAMRLFSEFQKLVGEELDYLHEQANLEDFREHFKKVAAVRVPEVFLAYTRPKVLVMELVEGVKLTDAVGLAEWQLDPKLLARELVTAYLKQIIEDGLVQIDPHPGNFLADRQGRLVLLDFGMCGHIPKTQMPFASQLIQGVLAKDARVVVQSMVGLGFIRADADVRLLVRAMSVLLQQLGGVRLEPGPELDRAVADFQDFLYQEPLEFPAEYMFLGRAIGMLFGLVSELDPSIDWLALVRQEALPLINAAASSDAGWSNTVGEWVGRVFGPEAAIATRLVVGRLGDEASRLGRLPATLERVLLQMDEGALRTEPSWTPLMRRLDMLAQQIRLLTATVFLAASGMAWLFWTGHRGHGWLLVIGLVALAIWLRAGIRLNRMSRRHRPPSYERGGGF
jgi:predicted unusual protein kinase regulating ubiquinone biosynthesis (AarF/ABC1/UbiB family)